MVRTLTAGVRPRPRPPSTVSVRSPAPARSTARRTPDVLAKADRGRGRVVFNKVCATCHALYGHGGAVGPDLTGGGRDNLDYLLENILDPGATVGADFRVSVVATADGRVLNGLIRARTDRTLTLQTQTEALTLQRGDIEQVKPSTPLPDARGPSRPAHHRRGPRPDRLPQPEDPGAAAGLG